MNKPGSSATMLTFPLSFHADTHHNVGSACNMGNVAAKYSKKSGEMSRSSENTTGKKNNYTV